MAPSCEMVIELIANKGPGVVDLVMMVPDTPDPRIKHLVILSGLP
jgi:hypothetical protein